MDYKWYMQEQASAAYHTVCQDCAHDSCATAHSTPLQAMQRTINTHSGDEVQDMSETGTSKNAPPMDYQ